MFAQSAIGKSWRSRRFAFRNFQYGTSIISDPTVGDVIRGLDGVRKVRFAMGGHGKSGGGRAIYYSMLAEGAVLMITVYAKSRKSDLTPADRKAIASVLKETANGE